jgi:Holliday junction resolvase-like predicted endonuclease
LPPALRTGALPGITGHVAESLVEMILSDHGYVPLAHRVGPAQHGADLIMLHLTSEMAFAVEVKGTLRPRHVPHLTRGELDQMSTAWVDKSDNPAMASTRAAKRRPLRRRLRDQFR